MCLACSNPHGVALLAGLASSPWMPKPLTLNPKLRHCHACRTGIILNPTLRRCLACRTGIIPLDATSDVAWPLARTVVRKPYTLNPKPYI